jgi:hypothetical protein
MVSAPFSLEKENARSDMRVMGNVYCYMRTHNHNFEAEKECVLEVEEMENACI